MCENAWNVQFIGGYRSEERGLSRKHIIESVKASLLRLQLSYIDVVIVHKADPMCPMEGTLYQLIALFINTFILHFDNK